MDPIWLLPGNSLRLSQAPPARRTGGTEGTDTAGEGQGEGQPSLGRSHRPPPRRGVERGDSSRAVLTGSHGPCRGSGAGLGDEHMARVTVAGEGVCERPQNGAVCLRKGLEHPLQGSHRHISPSREGLQRSSVLEGHHILQGSCASAPRCLCNTREPYQSGIYSMGLSRDTRAHGH